jgi:hypothetical protein
MVALVGEQVCGEKRKQGDTESELFHGSTVLCLK